MREDHRRLAPLYAAAFVVLFCGVSAVNSTVEEPGLTTITVALLIVGVLSSLWMRVQQADQQVVVWVAAGVGALVLIVHPSLVEPLRHGLPAGGDTVNMSSGGIGVLMEAATILFSFTMLTNHSLLFAIVPSMALIGLMSSENLNPEMVTYFLGFILSTVFLMGYHAHLDRTADADRSSGREIPIRPFVVLSSGVVAGAFVLGTLTSAPLKFIGREVFAIASSKAQSGGLSGGNSPMGESESMVSLSGAPPHLSSAEVARVRMSSPHLLRTQVVDHYTGQAWNTPLQSFEVEAAANEGTPGVNRFILYREASLRRLKKRALLTLQVHSVLGVPQILTVAEPFRVVGPMDRLRVDPHLTVQTDSRTAGMDYTVTSLVSSATPDELRHAPSAAARMGLPFSLDTGTAAAAISSTTSPAQEWERREIHENTRLPDKSRLHQVLDLAERVTRGRTNDYDRAAAIEQYLKSHFTYTQEPPLLPAEADATSFFLFTSRAGYCEHFATAMAVMLRLLGIPARFVGGYATGDYDVNRGEWIVRDLDSHAWVEVYFPDFGWVSFDPTGGVEAESPSVFSFSRMFSRLARIFESRQFLPTMILFAILSVFVYVFKTEAYDRYLREPVDEFLMRSRGRGATDPIWAVDRSYRKVRHQLARRGLVVSPGTTPLELLQAAQTELGPANPGVTDPLERLVDIYNLAAYSPSGVPAGAGAASEAWARQVGAALKVKPPDAIASQPESDMAESETRP